MCPSERKRRCRTKAPKTESRGNRREQPRRCDAIQSAIQFYLLHRHRHRLDCFISFNFIHYPHAFNFQLPSLRPVIRYASFHIHQHWLLKNKKPPHAGEITGSHKFETKSAPETFGSDQREHDRKRVEGAASENYKFQLELKNTFQMSLKSPEDDLGCLCLLQARS